MSIDPMLRDYVLYKLEHYQAKAHIVKAVERATHLQLQVTPKRFFVTIEYLSDNQSLCMVTFDHSD